MKKIIFILSIVLLFSCGEIKIIKDELDRQWITLTVSGASGFGGGSFGGGGASGSW